LTPTGYWPPSKWDSARASARPPDTFNAGESARSARGTTSLPPRFLHCGNDIRLPLSLDLASTEDRYEPVPAEDFSMEEIRPANHWFHFPLQAIALYFCVRFYFHLPSSNKALLILGGMAALMVRMDMKPLHKGIYILLVLSLVLIENRALNKERKDSNDKQAQLRKEENDRFQGIADGLTASIKQSQMQFNATMFRFNESLKTTTGGNSYCYFTFNFGGLPELIHHGMYTLYDLHANFLDWKQSFIVGTEWLVGSPITVGEMAVGSNRLITGISKPPNLTDPLNFDIFFGARNGFWREEFRGRYVNKEWVEAIRLFKENGPPFSRDVLILEKVDRQFPRDKNGKAIWN
jgi:hypothetical protein